MEMIKHDCQTISRLHENDITWNEAQLERKYSNQKAMMTFSSEMGLLKISKTLFDICDIKYAEKYQ